MFLLCGGGWRRGGLLLRARWYKQLQCVDLLVAHHRLKISEKT